MNDIETLLKGVLPTKKKKSSEVKTVEIHDLLEGKYVAENIFLIENKFKINYDHIGNKLNKFKIHPLINKYCGLVSSNINDLIFIDTETTGLAGGTGTYIFLIGIGFFEDDEIILKQFFLTDLANEKDLIDQLLRSTNKKNIYVSYNGKCYDIPLINTRSIFNRCKARLNKFNSIDLLHISRRLWRNKLENYSLQNIEQMILKSNRLGEKDIPGSEIPDAYFNYLSTKNATTMKNVIYHNKIDILSLIVLFEKINSILFSEKYRLENKFEIGRLYLQSEFFEKAISIFENILREDPADLSTIKELSFIHKQNSDLKKASSLWLEAVKHNDHYAYVELAKLEEHRNKNYEKALAWTEKALNSKYEENLLGNEDIKELKHRKQRLELKISSLKINCEK